MANNIIPGDRPSRMLAVVLGASTFPNAPNLTESRAFDKSAADLKEYLWEDRGLALPMRNVLSLFDDSRSPSDQLVEIASFLSRRKSQLENEGSRPDSLLIYYVGHGLFTRGDQAYCLAVRCTNGINEGATSIRACDLAGVVKENAAFLRRYLIFDCCFAASIHKEFQSGPLAAARLQLKEEFPDRGTALLCSSNAREPSLAPTGLRHTMFSHALMHVLLRGHEGGGPLLSFSEVGDLIKEDLRNTYPDGWVRPEVHSPDQREGDIAHIPLFPNPAYGVGQERRKEAKAPGEGEGENERPELQAQSPSTKPFFQKTVPIESPVQEDDQRQVRPQRVETAEVTGFGSAMETIKDSGQKDFVRTVAICTVAAVLVLCLTIFLVVHSAPTRNTSKPALSNGPAGSTPESGALSPSASGHSPPKTAPKPNSQSSSTRPIDTPNGDSNADQNSEGAVPPRRLSISAGIMAANLLQETAPEYPPIAKAARIQGTVVLQATITRTGSIQNLRIISGPPMLQQAALDAVRNWRYKPYLLNGNPVEVETTVNVAFNLGG